MKSEGTTTANLMRRRPKIAVAALALLFTAFAANTQSPAAQIKKATFEPMIAVTPTTIPVGKPVQITFTVKNITDTPQIFPEWQIRVEGKTGEPSMTYWQRQRTGKLLPGEAQLRGGGAREILQPGSSSSGTLDILSFYDLSTPGKYKVFVEIEDSYDKSGTVFLRRSPTLTFEVVGVSN